MYIILLNKLRFDQNSCFGRSGKRWQYGVPKWYEIVERLGIPGLEHRQMCHAQKHEFCKNEVDKCMLKNRGGEPIYYHGPHQLYITAGELQHQFIS